MGDTRGDTGRDTGGLHSGAHRETHAGYHQVNTHPDGMDVMMLLTPFRVLTCIHLYGIQGTDLIPRVSVAPVPNSICYNCLQRWNLKHNVGPETGKDKVVQG